MEARMAKFRAAVIGLGRIASTFDEEIPKYGGLALPHAHIACYLAVPEVELVGLADSWPEQREAARRKWRFEAVHADYREMLQELKPDVVSVCTSTKPRAEILLDLANGGYGLKAIFAEKPLTFSLEEADRVIEACRRNGIVLAVNASRRWHDTYRQAVQMVSDGLIGELLHVQAQGATNLSEAGVHVLTTLTMFMRDRAQWVMGEAESDEAAANDEDLAGAGYLGFANGVRAYFRTFPSGSNEWGFDVCGTRGMIRLMQDARAAEHWTMEAGLEGGGAEAVARRFLPPPRTQRPMGINAVYDVLDCIESGAEPKSSGEDAREALEIAIGTRESHRRGNVRVELPLTDRSLRIVSSEVVRWGGEVPRAVLREREAAKQADSASP
jgi:predicted dehydrogenase